MQIVTKVTGGSLSATEFNQIPDEIENTLSGTGQAPSNSDLFQLAKAIADYSAHGDFYTDSGTSTAFVLTKQGSKQAPTVYADGYRARFFAGSTTSGPSTVNISGIGAKSIVDGGGFALILGSMLAGDLQTIVFDSSNDRFILVTEKLNSNTNLIINGNFLINQRSWILTPAQLIKAGDYMVDRWKGSNTSGTILFTLVNNETVVTVPIGGFEQVIEGLSIQSGTHTISFIATGDTVCEINGVPTTSGINFSLVGATDVTVKFSSVSGTGTVKLVQLEAGFLVTPFEQRLFGMELIFCKRYYQTRLVSGGFGNASLAVAHSTAATSGVQLPIEMRVAPTVALFARDGTPDKISTYLSAIKGTVVTAGLISTKGFHNCTDTGTGFTIGETYELFYTADAEL